MTTVLQNATPENAQKFNKACAERNIVWSDVVQLITKHVEAAHPRQGDRGTLRSSNATIAGNMRKELSRPHMTEKVLVKGLKVIGLSVAEIEAIVKAS